MIIIACMKMTMVRLSPRLHQSWREAATCEEMSMAAFLRLALRERVQKILSREKSGVRSNQGNKKALAEAE